MLNYHQNIINNYLNNAICEELDKDWLKRLLPESKSSLVQGYYNAGILVIKLSEFNNDSYYDTVIKEDFSKACEQLYAQLKPILEVCLRRMFKNFNENLKNYDVVLFMEGAEDDEIPPVKFNFHVF